MASSLLIACATTQKNKEEAELHLQIGTSFLNQGKYPQALKELLKAEEMDANNAVLENNLGIAYFVRDKYDDAQLHLEKALKINSEYSDARNNLGRVLIEKSQYDHAISLLEIVIKDLTYATPDKAWVNLGLAYFHKGQYPIAKSKFAEALRINRQNCVGQTFYGRSLLEIGDFEFAARALDNAISICGVESFEEPHFYSGLSYYKLGQTARAMARLEEVVKLYPNGQFANRAQSLMKMMK